MGFPKNQIDAVLILTEISTAKGRKKLFYVRAKIGTQAKSEKIDKTQIQIVAIRRVSFFCSPEPK